MAYLLIFAASEVAVELKPHPSTGIGITQLQRHYQSLRQSIAPGVPLTDRRSILILGHATGLPVLNGSDFGVRELLDRLRRAPL